MAIAFLVFYRRKERLTLTLDDLGDKTSVTVAGNATKQASRVLDEQLGGAESGR